VLVGRSQVASNIESKAILEKVEVDEELRIEDVKDSGATLAAVFCNNIVKELSFRGLRHQHSTRQSGKIGRRDTRTMKTLQTLTF
jgi:ribosomal protein S13